MIKDPLSPDLRRKVDKAAEQVVADVLKPLGPRRHVIRKNAAYPLYPPITDPVTVWRLWTHYGEGRCADIVAGRDRATAEDITAWRNLGRVR